MITAKVNVNLDGFNYLTRGNSVNRAVRIAINKASSPVKAKLAHNAPVFRNYLSKSMRIKVILHTRKKGGGFTSIIGPSGKYIRKKGKYKYGKKKGEARMFRPARYAHIAERKTHYSQRTMDSSRNQFEQTLIESVKEQFRLAAAKVK